MNTQKQRAILRQQFESSIDDFRRKLIECAHKITRHSLSGKNVTLADLTQYEINAYKAYQAAQWTAVRCMHEDLKVPIADDLIVLFSRFVRDTATQQNVDNLADKQEELKL